MKEKVILFGAGENGKAALELYGKENICCFCDNNIKKIGTTFMGKKVISFQKMLELYGSDFVIVVTPMDKRALCEQLKQHGITDYLEYIDKSNESIRYPVKAAKNDRNRYKDQNERLDQYVEECKNQEFIGNIDNLKKIIAPLLKNEFLIYRGKQGESNHYGNLEAILNYANIDLDEADFFPVVSHINTHLDHITAPYNKSMILSGNYFKKFVHEKYAYVPVFTIGPYIYYANGLYDIEMKKEIKEKYGKILTIFLPHSIETMEVSYNSKLFIDKILNNYKKEFDTILACVYWADINKPICGYLESRGIRLACAGVRFDAMFNRRLKTILELSDAIVCGEMGTYIQYALFYNKPVSYIKCGVDFFENKHNYEKIKDYAQDVYKFEQLFNEKLEITPMQISFMDSVAGFEKIRDKKYIQNILRISKDIWKNCEYDFLKYPVGVYFTYNEYMMKNDLERARILRGAVGENFI